PLVGGSSVSFCNFASSVPGLSVPVSVLPSQSKSSSRRFSSPFFNHQSPLQDPFSGYPNCAKAGTTIARRTRKQIARKIFDCISFNTPSSGTDLVSYCRQKYTALGS